MKLIVIDGRIVGTTTDDDPNGYALLDPPEGFDGDLDAVEYDAGTETAVWSLDALRARRVDDLRRLAAERIEALAWRIERAREREVLGAPGETLVDVLAAREAIRRASNRAEAEIAAAPDVESIRAVTLEVTEADMVTPVKRETKVEVMDRFTDAELAGIFTAAKSEPQIEVWLEKYKLATEVVLDDPRFVGGVQGLEAAGLLAPGRAAEILA